MRTCYPFGCNGPSYILDEGGEDMMAHWHGQPVCSISGSNVRHWRPQFTAAMRAQKPTYVVPMASQGDQHRVHQSLSVRRNCRISLMIITPSLAADAEVVS